jgi:cytochrome c biogenesis protein CcmG/thiol:disulfide interchange protein DsbE
MLRYLLFSVLLIITTSVYGYSVTHLTDEGRNETEIFAYNIGDDAKIAPEFSLYTLEGDEIRLSDYAGKIVILDFWATWCPPCRKSIPDLISIQNEYKDDLIIIGISLDQPSTQVELQPFIESYGINYPVVLGTLEVVEAYGNIQAIPTSFIIDREGKITNKHVGLVPKSTLVDEIEALLNGS